METAPKTHRDSLIPQPTLLALTARLKSATQSGSYEEQANALDSIFHTLSGCLLKSGKIDKTAIELILGTQRQYMRHARLGEKSQTELKDRENDKDNKRLAGETPQNAG